jgi:hypothetical protein
MSRSHAHPWFADARFALHVKEYQDRLDDQLHYNPRVSAQISEFLGVEVTYRQMSCEAPGFNARLASAMGLAK